MAASLYEQLPLKERDIRLLKLYPPVSGPSLIVSTLSVANLVADGNKFPLSYKALSYSWGNDSVVSRNPGQEKEKMFILCNGSSYRVPPNLFAALVRLQPKEGVVTVWIDYLCINQADVNERNEQVAMMGEIFSRSFEVIVWLGEPPENESDRLWLEQYHWEGNETDVDVINAYWTSFHEYMRQGPWFQNSVYMSRSSVFSLSYIENWRGHHYGAFCLLSRLSQGFPLSQTGFYEATVESLHGTAWARDIRNALWDIADKAWWKRTWVVQECVLASKATVHYGNLSAPWDMFGRAAKFLMQSLQRSDLSRQTNFRVSSDLHMKSLQRSDPTRWDNSRVSSDLHRATKDPLVSLSTYILQIDSAREALISTRPSSPLDTLRRFHGREAIDSKDKVFGLLGLMHTPLLRPDYSLTTAEVFLETAMRIISSTMNLEVLAGIQASTQAGLPSWCPNWGVPPRDNEWQRLQCFDLYNASSGLPKAAAAVHHRPFKPILALHGLLLDRVQYVTKHLAPEDGYTRLRDREYNWRDEIRRFLGFTGLVRRLFPDDDYSEDQGSPNTHQSEVVKEEGHTESRSESTWDSLGYDEAFWRTLCGDLIVRDESHTYEARFMRASREDAGSYHEWVREGRQNLTRRTSTVKGFRRFINIRSDTANMKRNRFFYAVQLMAGGRRMFVTENGRLGLGPTDTRAGDQVAVLCGSTVPFILRVAKDQTCEKSAVSTLLPRAEHRNMRDSEVCNSIHHCHAIVGDAFVLGLMDGEAVGQEVELENIYLE